jgi:hypothetical protein
MIMAIKVLPDIFMDQEIKKELNKILKEKFYCPSRFAQEIEITVQQEKCSYIDAIIFFCDKNKIDLESVPKLLSKPLKEKIKCEAIELNFLKKTSRARLVF